MKKRRRISLRESFREAASADRGGGGEEAAVIFVGIWYWLFGVPVAEGPKDPPSVETP